MKGVVKPHASETSRTARMYLNIGGLSGRGGEEEEREVVVVVVDMVGVLLAVFLGGCVSWGERLFEAHWAAD